MNIEKIILELKKNKNISDAECFFLSTTSFSFTLFKKKIINFSNNSTNLINIKAIVNNKLVTVETENTEKKNIIFLIKNLLEFAKYTGEQNAFIFNKQEKYDKYQYYNEELNTINNQNKFKLIFQIEKMIKEYDKRIDNIEINYCENFFENKFKNTANINLSKKYNCFSIDTCVTIKENKEIKTASLSFNDNNLKQFNINNYVKEICENVIKKLHPIKIKTDNYKVIFDAKVVTTLIYFYITQLDAEKILKNSSWFKDKINKKIADEKITIIDTPLEKNINFSAYDAQGVPKKNIILIENGILKTYLHNLKTAKIFNVEPTGHANIKNNIEPNNPHLKPGNLTKKTLLTKIDNGIYITSIEGLHAGMNVETGNFSLKSEGFVINNGEIKEAIDMVIITSNLYHIFENIKDISENIEYEHKQFSPCISVENIFISCE